MNNEQKQRAIKLITYWRDRSITTMPEEHFVSGDCMTDLLQELIDAPEPEPVGYTNETELDYVRKYEALPVSGTFWPTSDEDACVALYTAPPANNQSEQHLEMVNTPAPSVPDGWQPIETAPKDNKRSLFLARFNDDGTMQAFDYDGTWQSERESWELPQVYYYWATALGKVEEPTHWMYEPEWFSKLNSAQQPAPPADLDAPEFSDGCEKEGFPGGCARMGCCKQLPATANPARTGSSQIEPPADLVRDAERWLSEHDLELLVTFGMQADDCDADGHTLSKEQTRRLCELGVLRHVGFGRHEMTAFGDSIFGVHFSQGISLPLHTHAEYNAAIERNKQKGGEA